VAAHKAVSEELLDLLQTFAKEYVDQDGAICTSFVLVSEWMSSKGGYYSFTITDNDSPPWRHEGLLNYAISNEIYPEETEGDEA